MSSSPGLPQQQATTTSLSLLQQNKHQNHQNHSIQQSQQHQNNRLQKQKQHQKLQHHRPPLSAVSPSKSPRNNGGGDSEAETVVLQSIEVASNTRKNDDDASECERGRRRRGSEARPPAEQERPRRRGPLRPAAAKRRFKEEERDDEYSSDLSTAPSRSSRPNSPSHHLRRRLKHGTSHQKPKVRDGSSESEGDNSDREDARHSRLRSRKRRRSVMDSSPPNHRIKSSPPISPPPLGSPPMKSSTRIREKAHAGQRTLKHRRAPPAPVLTNRGNISSSSSRENSPSSVPRPRRPQSVRTPGSPMSNSHKPKRDTAGRTHLHRACQRGDVAEVEAILNSGTEFLNAEDNAGYQPLHEACLHGHLDVAKILIDKGAQIDQPSKIEQDTPLLDAVENGHTEVVRYLLELGANPRKRNKQGQTAMDANESNRETKQEVYAEIEGLLKAAISELRKQRPSDDENARASAAADSHSSRDPSVASPVHQSPPAPSIPSGARRRNARTEQSRKDLLWLDAGKNGLQKLREMAREGDQQMVGALLERGTKPDTESLILAIRGGHEDTVSLLLAYGEIEVDPEPGSSQGHRKSRDSSMPVGEETPMLAAIGRGNLEIIRYLLANGVNPRRLDHRGKSYMDIARDREGDFWQDEVEMLQKAYNDAGDGGRPEKATRRGRSPENYRNTSPKPKKTNDTKGISAGSRRPNSNPLANTPRQSASTGPSRWASTSANPTKYEDTTAVSDQEEVSAEPLGPPRNRSKKGKRSESDSIDPPVAKKKRRLVSGRDLANEESLARSSQEPTRSVPPESDIDSKEKAPVRTSKKQRASSAMEETIRVEQKPIILRKLGVGSEDIRMSDSATERATHKVRNDDSNLLRPDNIPSSKDKKPTLGGKRDRTRSPTAHSDSGRKPEKEEPRKQRKLVDKQERYDSDTTAKRVAIKVEGKPRKLPPRRDSPDGRRQSVSTTEVSEKEERQRILREREDSEAKNRRDREQRQRARDDEARELRRQEALRKELESILEKARQESKRVSEDQVISRELEFRRQREEKDRQERELREREEREQEEREAREKEAKDREKAAAREIARRQAAEREAKEREERESREREAREREAREREAREREAEQKRREEEIREERRQAEETRKREEAIRRAEQEVLQKKLAEEQRRKEEEEEEAEKQRQLKIAEEQRRAAAEAERKRIEEEVRKQEFERAKKEAESRREAELLQQQLAQEAERKRIEDERARKRALPFALRQVEENGGMPLESSRFMPLYSAIIDPSTTANSTPTKPGINGCGPPKLQQYILNVQAALVLGSTDLQFSSHTAIHKREVDDQQRLRMWSVLSVMLCESVHLSGSRSIEELEQSRREEREKFLKMSPVFWMKVDDFRAIIQENPRYANLVSQTTRTVDVDLSCSSTSATLTKVNGDGPVTPSSSTIKKEEMARRLQRLFGTPLTSSSLQYNNQSHVTSSSLSSQLTVSMPPPTPLNATNATSTSN